MDLNILISSTCKKMKSSKKSQPSTSSRSKQNESNNGMKEQKINCNRSKSKY